MSDTLEHNSPKLQFKTVKTDTLIEYARNPRKNDDVVDKMVSCINEFGFRIPIVAKSDGSVIDGHLRLKAAKKLGLDEVPIVIADDLTEAQIKAFRLVANQSANWAEWNDELLKLELEDLKDLDFDLDLTGFDLKEIEQYLRNEELEEDDYLEEDIEENQSIVTKQGDLWLLGNHRLMCGDATDYSAIEVLMNKKIADLVFTDPPYNVRVMDTNKRKWLHEEFSMASGEMSQQEFIGFLKKSFKNLVKFSKNGSIHFVCMNWKHIYEIVTAGRNVYSELKQLCIWCKSNWGLGKFYRNQHELVFVFKNGSSKHTVNFSGDRSNIWTYSFSTGNRNELLDTHPTVKPLKLVADAILDCSNSGELVLDLFGGSGTTLIACEETDRKCCMMEFEPKYCDTIIHRWQKCTGQLAIHADTGKTFDEMAGE